MYNGDLQSSLKGKKKLNLTDYVLLGRLNNGIFQNNNN
jgi:hypothetical protein